MISMQRLRNWLRPNAHRLELARDGWPAASTSLDEAYWSHFVERERVACEELIACVRAGGDVLALDGDERIKRATFGEVIAIAAAEQPRLTVLDVGGNLGDYYWIGRSLHPQVELEFHCLDINAVAEAGRRVNPAVTFHGSGDIFERRFDLIMFSSSLQYMRDWQTVLARAAAAARKYLFVSDVPTVQHAPSFVVAQHADGHVNRHHQFNRGELVAALARTGLCTIREFDMGAHPIVDNAPEQPVCTGWLLGRRP